MRSLIMLVFSVVSLVGVAATAPVSLLPPVGGSVTFTVTSHTDSPFHNHGGYHGYHGYGGFHGGGPGAGGAGSGPGEDSSASGDFADFLRDRKGTLTLNHTSSGITVTTSGAVDSFYSPLAVTRQGTVDPGGPPDRFIVAFDNASALAQALHPRTNPGDSWNATLQLLVGPDALQALPVAMKVVSVNGNDVAMQGTGQGNVTLATQMGDQPASINVTVSADIAGSQLHAYAQKVVQTMTMHDHNVTITTTTSLASPQ